MSYLSEQAKLNTERAKVNTSSIAIDNVLRPLSNSKDLTLGFIFKSRSYIANGKLKISKKLLQDNRETILTVNELPVVILLAYASEVQNLLDYENGIRNNFPK